MEDALVKDTEGMSPLEIALYLVECLREGCGEDYVIR
jgi:hypothetical protein